MKQSSLVLFVNTFPPTITDSLRSYAEKTGGTYETALICDSKHAEKVKSHKIQPAVIIPCDFSNPVKIEKALLPYKERIVGITCFGETNVPFLRRVIPHLPYIEAPSSESLKWATNKIMMRRLFAARNKRITPKFTVIRDDSEAAIESIKKKVGYPLVLKPAGLASSLLVTMCFHEEEIKKTLKKMFRRIKTLYATIKPDFDIEKAEVLVEAFMEGEMYSVDAYVNSDGGMVFCPFVHVKTGRHIGFEDFFGYNRITPTTLSKEEIYKGREVTKEAVRALNLRTTTVHVELMKTDDGWKIIELGPRIGGFRHLMYSLSFGIDHVLNDTLNHIGKKPEVSHKTKGYTSQLKFYPKKEGVLNKVAGIKKIQKLESYHKLEVLKKVGDQCKFAKHGGGAVVDLTLFNPNRSNLLADIRRVEQTLKITIKEKSA